MCLNCITYKNCSCDQKAPNCTYCICFECKENKKNRDSDYCYYCSCPKCKIEIKNSEHVDFMCDTCDELQNKKLNQMAAVYSMMRGMNHIRGRGRGSLSNGRGGPKALPRGMPRNQRK